MLTNEKAVEVLVTPTTAENQIEPPESGTESTPTEAQIERMLVLLCRGPRSTHELRQHRISNSAGRVHDLTRQGFRIATDRGTTVNSDSFSRSNVALYAILSEPVAPDGSTNGGT